MKRKLFIPLALISIVLFGSCKKDYVCTCTTVIVTGSTTKTHRIDNATYTDAKRDCRNYEDQANASLPGGTTCHL